MTHANPRNTRKTPLRRLLSYPTLSSKYTWVSRGSRRALKSYNLRFTKSEVRLCRMRPARLRARITRPIYMGRIMNTYPVSDSEMKRISSVNDQVTVRCAVATLLFGLASSIWINAIFNAAMTPAGTVATFYIAPILLVFAIGYGIGGFVARRTSTSEWERIKTESAPVQSMAATVPMIAQGKPAT